MSAYDANVLDLLADQATGDLSKDDRATLASLLQGSVDESMEIAAAAATVAMLAEEVESMPRSLHDRLVKDAEAFSGLDEPPLVLMPAAEPAAGRPVLAVLGWVAAAACLVIAVAAWWPSKQVVPSIEAQMAMFIDTCTDVEEAAWGQWAPTEYAGVSGKVLWSESQQRGYLVFDGLRVNDPAVEQYQLWIVDERGLADEATGQSQRISGAIFDAANGRTIVEIDPAIVTQDANMFAVTVEQPGGVWASAMDRRVVVASLTK